MSNLACSVCGKSGDDLQGKQLSRCSRCASAVYCSRECQVTAFPSHKAECKRIAASRSAPVALQTSPSPPPETYGPHPGAWDLFTPFIDSILSDMNRTLSVACFPELQLYGPERRPGLFHVHFVFDPEAVNSRRTFKLKLVRASNQASFLSWVRSVPTMIEEVVQQYKGLMDQFERKQEIELGGLTPDERDHLPSTWRYAASAMDQHGNFLGVRFVSLKDPYRTRSGRDPRNANLDILGALQSVLSQAVPLQRGMEDTRLLEKITKAYIKDEEWVARAAEAWDVRKGENQADGMRENLGLIWACLKTGISEKVMFGGQYRSAYAYAVCVPEWPVKCTCGKMHGSQGHLDEDEDEDVDEHERFEEEDDEPHPGHSVGGHGRHSHSHGGQACGGHSH